MYLVCVKFLTKFYQRLEDKNVDKSDTEMVEGNLMKFCKETRNDKEDRFVSYLSIRLVTRELLCLLIVLLHWWFSYFSY